MDKPKVLPGHVLVAKGITKLNTSLPEVGLKDVIPNGSWIEQKQIQTALEARKHLIEVERIDKVGAVSHAIWRDDLQLAEVTQMVGGYWRFFGHNVDKTLYLRPEETLYLMEINCLILKHNDITVSLQKAHSLVLETISYKQYRVYASLSRLGYKVYRHNISKTSKEDESSSCQKSNMLSSPKSSDKQFLEIVVVNNILDQPFTNTSQVTLDNKAYEYKQSLAEPSSNAKENKIIGNKGIEQTDRDNSNQLNKDVAIPLGLMDVDANELGSNNITENKVHNNESLTTNTNNVGTENKVETSKTELSKNETIQIENTDFKNSQCEEKMEIDTVTLKQCSTGSVANESKTKEKCTNVENVDTSNVTSCVVSITSNSNVDSNERVHIDDQNKTDSMDASDESSQIVADSTVLCNDSNGNRNVHSRAIEDDSADLDIVMESGTLKGQDSTSDNIVIDDTNKIDICSSDVLTRKRNRVFQNYVTKLKRLTSRQYKSSDFKTVDKHFETVPDLFNKEVVTINAPEQHYIPKNIFVNNSCYVLNLKQIKSVRCNSVDSTAYNSSDEVNGNHVRRVGSSWTTNISQNIQFDNNIRFPSRPNFFYRPYNFWRPHNNYAHFNMVFQRPWFSNIYFPQRFQYQTRPNLNNVNLNCNNPNMNVNPRKRMRSAKATHFQSIKNLAIRLKQLIMSGNTHIQNTESLHRVLYSYNMRFKTRLRLTEDFEVVNDETIVETIDLEDEDEAEDRNKRPRLSQDADKFNENLNLLRQLAVKLKDLNNKATSKHKRALSKLIKTFNKSYDADIYINANFEVIDKRFINIDSDSELDCVVTESENVYKGKKVRNPFSILKRRSGKLVEPKASTSRDSEIDGHDTNGNSIVLIASNQNKSKNNIQNDEIEMSVIPDDTACSQPFSNNFNKNWLPGENDFGKPEIVLKNTMSSRLTDVIRDEYFLSFLKNHFDEFDNWLQAKVAFLLHMEETDTAFQNASEQLLTDSARQPGIKPLIDPDDSLDSASILEKLRIIKNNKEIDRETTLNIDFDVFYRDVASFKKSNPPKPHFRIICIEEMSPFPSNADVMSLYSKYNDNISIVFAVVGINSVSYLQIKPTDLPVYVASNDLD